jgi:hypothetical protein
VPAKAKATMLMTTFIVDIFQWSNLQIYEVLRRCPQKTQFVQVSCFVSKDPCNTLYKKNDIKNENLVIPTKVSAISATDPKILFALTYFFIPHSIILFATGFKAVVRITTK